VQIERQLSQLLHSVYSFCYLPRMTHSAFDRPNISTYLCNAIRDDITSGALAAGGRVNEVHLAQRLSVSRTPLREALSHLAAEGLLECIPRRGFFIKPLTVEEVEQLYPLRPLLDPKALHLAGIPDARCLQELRLLNLHIAKSARKPGRIVDLDNEWHRRLLAHCPNRILLAFIEHLISLTRRYEFAYMAEGNNAEAATAEHEAIIDALERGNLASACKLLRQNLTTAKGPLLAWLRAKEQRS
jgi:DNA-binding GntR family transcriptional regulator